MRKNVTTITILVLAIFIMIVGIAGCNTSCNTRPTSTLVPTSTVATETKTITGEVIATSEVDGSKVVIIETEIDGVKVTETSVVNTTENVTIGDTVTVTTTTTVAPVDTTTTTNSTTTIPTNGNPTGTSSTTTTTTTTQATPTPKPNYGNNDINFGNDESAASDYQNNNGGTVETTTVPTNTPVPTATPEPTATPTPEPTEAPTEPEPTDPPVPDTGYAIIKVKVTSNIYDNDEDVTTHQEVDYFEVEGWTSNYHSTTPSDYHYDGDIIASKMESKYGDYLKGYSAKTVEVVSFTN